MQIARELAIGVALTVVLGVAALRLVPPALPPAPPGAMAAPSTGATAGTPTPPVPTVPAATHAAAQPAPVPTPAPRDRHGRPIDLQGDDVAAYIARRAGAARTGDARAAFEIYQATALCVGAGRDLPEFAMPDERAQAEAERRRVGTLCAGVSAMQLQERMAFLERAAAAGARDARIDFFTEGPQGRGADLEQDAADPQVQAWKIQALDYLRQAGAECDPFALDLLSNAYDLGRLTPRDPRMAMAYAVAAAAARGGALPEQPLRERFGTLLSAEQFGAALRAGATLARQACPAGS